MQFVRLQSIGSEMLDIGEAYWLAYGKHYSTDEKLFLYKGQLGDPINSVLLWTSEDIFENSNFYNFQLKVYNIGNYPHIAVSQNIQRIGFEVWTEIYSVNDTSIDKILTEGYIGAGAYQNNIISTSEHRIDYIQIYE